MRTKIQFLWYDGWVGFFWDRRKRRLYIGILPTIILSIQFKKKKVEKEIPEMEVLRQGDKVYWDFPVQQDPIKWRRFVGFIFSIKRGVAMVQMINDPDGQTYRYRRLSKLHKAKVQDYEG
jgi:hypothetical protein